MLVRLVFSDGNTLTRDISDRTFDMIMSKPYSDTWLHFNGEKVAVLESIEVLDNESDFDNEVNKTLAYNELKKEVSDDD
ncbi:hypothetical protein JavanS212_0007 [Streptococcus satellite phage Javan212]|nr:hypothetical protein JavanS212_0007 [Streptococcus satellite phage Javan212]SEK49364.1 hypothetical protein SAMN04487838_1042 [Streptococcus equinus]